MLAQNFMSAADLGIRDEWRDALIKVLVMLETGKLPKQDFDMNSWGHMQCGTPACIGGWAERIGGFSINSENYPPALYYLFYPRLPDTIWSDITPGQGARALRSYLTTGDSHWELAVAD